MPAFKALTSTALLFSLTLLLQFSPAHGFRKPDSSSGSGLVARSDPGSFTLTSLSVIDEEQPSPHVVLQFMISDPATPDKPGTCAITVKRDGDNKALAGTDLKCVPPTYAASITSGPTFSCMDLSVKVSHK